MSALKCCGRLTDTPHVTLRRALRTTGDASGLPPLGCHVCNSQIWSSFLGVGVRMSSDVNTGTHRSGRGQRCSVQSTITSGNEHRNEIDLVALRVAYPVFPYDAHADNEKRGVYRTDYLRSCHSYTTRGLDVSLERHKQQTQPSRGFRKARRVRSARSPLIVVQVNHPGLAYRLHEARCVEPKAMVSTKGWVTSRT